MNYSMSMFRNREDMYEKMVEDVAAGMFATDWPRDDWKKFGPNDTAAERYRAMARTALEVLGVSPLNT